MASRRVAWAGNPDPGLADWEGKLASEVLRKLVLFLQKCREKRFDYRFLNRHKCVSRVRQDSLQVLPI